MKTGQETGQVPRALRAGVFAVVCVLLAALGHAVMSGVTVPWWAVAVALSTTGACAWFLAGRERGPLLITLATVGAQTGLHSFFTLAQNVARNAAHAAGTVVVDLGAGATGGGTAFSDICDGSGRALAGPGTGAPPPMDHMGGMDMGMNMDMGTGMSTGMSHGPDMAGMAMHAGHGALGMWSAHVLVAALCGVWLSGGEQAAFRLGRTVAARLRAPLILVFHDVPVRPGPPRVRARRGRAAQRLRRLLYAHVLDTRGPPALLAVR
ncbi:hypothetical protein AB0K89_17350 [Streptomyces cinnamoneus]|uniref:hypothetical protein n=1 Tax=Streptomyces cinnamoneus TaxID=53446 RepID=UPI003438D0BE